MKWKIKKKKRIQFIFLCLCFFWLMGCGRISGFSRELTGDDRMDMTTEESELSEEATTKGDREEVISEIYVHVCGNVQNPGLYRLPSGIRAGEAIERAGGFTKKADTEAVNLAGILEDGMQLYVPSKEEKSESISETESSGKEVGEENRVGKQKVNLNTASLQELTSLSGIGETKAEAILSYREEKGSFSSIEDIKNVTGIGDGIFEKIKDSITV